MSDNLEIVMDIDTLEVFDVIDLDEDREAAITDTEHLPEAEKTSSYDDLNRVWTGDGYFYKSSSLLWEVIKSDIIHDLSLRNKHGHYPYYQHARDGTCGHVLQLTSEEALWKTLELNPELMSYV